VRHDEDLTVLAANFLPCPFGEQAARIIRQALAPRRSMAVLWRCLPARPEVRKTPAESS